MKTLQRFAGKCVSMNIAIPAAKLFCREVNASGINISRDVNISGDLKREIEHWNFSDNWKGVTPWRLELLKHLTIAKEGHNIEN